MNKEVRLERKLEDLVKGSGAGELERVIGGTVGPEVPWQGMANRLIGMEQRVAALLELAASWPHWGQWIIR